MAVSGKKEGACVAVNGDVTGGIVMGGQLEDTCLRPSSSSLYAMVSLKAPGTVPATRPALDLVAVVDCSGSMSGDKLKLVREALNTMMTQLHHRDRVALISFDSDVSVEMTLTPMDGEGKTAVNRRLNRMGGGSMTDLGGGLLQAYSLLADTQGTDLANHMSTILLFTDGQANIHMTHKEEIVRAVQSAASILTTQAQPMGPAVHTFGIGDEHDGDLLQGLSDATGGSYFHIDTREDMANCYEDCLGGLLSTLGQGLSLTLETVLPGVSFGATVSRPKGTRTEDGKQLFLSLGDLQAGEDRDVVFELSLDSGLVSRLQTQRALSRLAHSVSALVTATKDAVTVKSGSDVLQRISSKGIGMETTRGQKRTRSAHDKHPIISKRLRRDSDRSDVEGPGPGGEVALVKMGLTYTHVGLQKEVSVTSHLSARLADPVHGTDAAVLANVVLPLVDAAVAAVAVNQHGDAYSRLAQAMTSLCSLPTNEITSGRLQPIIVDLELCLGVLQNKQSTATRTHVVPMADGGAHFPSPAMLLESSMIFEPLSPPCTAVGVGGI